MPQPAAQQWASVEPGLTDVGFIGRNPAGHHPERFSVTQLERELRKPGRANDVLIASRSNGIKAHGTENQPCRHLSAIFVAYQSVGFGGIEMVHDVAYLLLCFPGLSGKIVEVSHMMAGLVTVSILPYEAGDVFHIASAYAFFIGEQGIKAGSKRIVSSLRRSKPVDVVWYIKAVLPGVGLGKMPVDHSRVEGFEPCPVETRTHKACLGVKKVFPCLRASRILAHNIFAAQLGSHGSHTPVVVGIFKGLAHRLMLLFAGQITKMLIIVEAKVIACAAEEHGVEGLIAVVTTDAFHPCIGNYRNAVVANHAPGFVGSKLPDGKKASLVVHIEHRTNKLVGSFRLGDGHERMPGTVSVPKRKHGVIVEVGGLMHFMIHSTITAVGVHKSIRLYISMIDRRIKCRKLIWLASFDFETIQHLAPSVFCLNKGCVETDGVGFGFEVVGCAIQIDCRDGYFYLHGFAFRSGKSQPCLKVSAFGRLHPGHCHIVDGQQGLAEGF